MGLDARLRTSRQRQRNEDGCREQLFTRFTYCMSSPGQSFSHAPLCARSTPTRCRFKLLQTGAMSWGLQKRASPIGLNRTHPARAGHIWVTQRI